MKNQVELIIVLIFGFSFLMYLFPFIFVEAAKLESGVTVNGTSTPETEKICDDTIDNDNDRKIDAGDQDCAAPATQCGLQILNGVPINYGQLSHEQFDQQDFSDVQNVMIKNVGTAPAKVMIKDGNWIGDSAPNTIRGEPEHTYVSFAIPQFLGSLTSNERELGQISGGQSLPVYFQVFRPLWPTGSYHQEVTIELHC